MIRMPKPGSVLKLAEGLAQAESEDAFLHAWCRAADSLGSPTFSACCFESDKPGTRATQTTCLMSENYRLEVFEAPYTSDPVMLHCRTQSAPLFWNRNTYLTAGNREKWEVMADYGMLQGLTIALHISAGRHYCVAVEWNADAAPTSDEMESAAAALQAYAVFAETCARRALLKQKQAQVLGNASISAREVECLHWIGRGMTDRDAARLLGISQHTVRKHVESCMDKLGAATRTEAAVLALRLGILDSMTPGVGSCCSR